MFLNLMFSMFIWYVLVFERLVEEEEEKGKDVAEEKRVVIKEAISSKWRRICSSEVEFEFGQIEFAVSFS